MSVSIRLAKYGKRNAPSYRVVVTPTRSKRGGKNIDIIGHYNPMNAKSDFTIDQEKYQKWVGNGAIVSEAVKKLLDGSYQFEKYEPKKEKPGESEAAAEPAAEAATEKPEESSPEKPEAEEAESDQPQAEE